MARLRERLDPDWKEGSAERPTAEKTGRNQFGLHCTICGGLFYVDEDTLCKVRSAIERGLSENPFCCDDCDEQFGEEEYEH